MFDPQKKFKKKQEKCLIQKREKITQSKENTSELGFISTS